MITKERIEMGTKLYKMFQTQFETLNYQELEELQFIIQCEKLQRQIKSFSDVFQ